MRRILIILVSLGIIGIYGVVKGGDEKIEGHLKPDANTIVLLQFDDADKPDKDSSGKGNDGNLLQGATISPDWGRYNGGLRLNASLTDTAGGMEHLTLPGKMFPKEEGTIEMWFNLEKFPKSGAVLVDYSREQGGFFLVATPNQYICYGKDESKATTFGAEPDHWTHIALSWSKNGGSIYINGKQALSLKPFTLPDTKLPCAIGGTLGGGGIHYGFIGIMDEIRVSDIVRYKSDFDIKVPEVPKKTGPENVTSKETTSERDNKLEVKEKQKGYFEAVAVPVKSADIRSIWAGPDAEGRPGKSIYLFTFPPDENQQLWLLRVDPDTGLCESFYTGAPMRRPRAVQSPSTDNDGWLYGDWDTMEYRFNPKTGELQELERVGLKWNFKTGRVEKISEQGAKLEQGINRFLTSIFGEMIGLRPVFAQIISSGKQLRILGRTDGPDGKQYTYRSDTSHTTWVHSEDEVLAHLWVYDPKTGEEKDLGVVPKRKWWQYPMMNVGPNGKLYIALAIAEPDIIVYDPKTGKEKRMLPEEFRRKPAWTITGIDSKGNLYYFLYECKAGLGPRQTFRVEDEKLIPIPLEEFPGYTGEEYPFTPPEPPSCQLADGRKVSFILIDGSPGYYGFEDRALKIYDPKTDKERIIHYDYSAPGIPIFGALSKGPDGKIYGLGPKHIFWYDPKTGRSDAYGISPAYNQVYDSLFYQGKFYTLSYGNGLLAVYDPSKPWRYGKDKDASPRDLGFVGGPGGNRFFNILIGPDEKIYAVSNPVNGYFGGSLIQFDPKTFESKYWWNELIPKHALQSLTVSLDKKGFWIGSSPFSVAAGDVDPTDTSAKLALWDLKTEKTVFTCVPVPDMLAIESLMTGPNGLIYGLGRLGTYKGTQPYWGGGIMFVFDTQKRQVVHENREYTPFIDIPHTMELGSDGLIYAIVDQGLCVIDPADNSMKMLARWPYGNIRSGLLIDGKNIYFENGASLVRFVMP